MITAVVKKHCS